MSVEHQLRRHLSFLSESCFQKVRVSFLFLLMANFLSSQSHVLALLSFPSSTNVQ